MVLSEERRSFVNDKYLELIEACNKFATESELRKIAKAYELAYKAEVQPDDGNKGLDLLHALEISLIEVNEMGLGSIAVISTLLHNIFEKKEIAQSTVQKKFDKNIAGILVGFSRISSLQTHKISIQSENFRKLFLSLIDDIRVILIKISHRLYDMRNFENLSKEKQITYMDEVVHLYIPIAHRLGLYKIKSDFEELTMRYSHPDIYQSLVEKIQASKTKQKSFLKDFINPIEREITVQGFDCEYRSRPKSVFSIWNKMKKQNVEFEEVYDIFAVRIITKSSQKKEKEDCWRIYSIVTDIYSPNPKRLRDWITTPKASGYESLHTTVKGPNGKWVEVQIRSQRMDENAEKGLAAHWRYKGFGSKKDSESWLNQVRDILENPNQIDFDDSFMDRKKRENDMIFIFTPVGDLKQLPIGSTVLDFAYEVHTEVGSKCNGAKVNGKVVPIRHVLNNGDEVEILTNKNQKPKMDWLNFVVTNKAKGRIKRALLEEKYQEAEAGNETIRRKFKSWKIPYNDETIDRVIKFYKFKTSVDFYYSVATEKIDLLKVRSFLENKEVENQKELPDQPLSPAKEVKGDKSDFLMISDKLKNVNYTLAKCCNPIPGDAVFGFVRVGKGITIHRLNCPNAANMLARYDYRVIDVKWQDSGETLAYSTTIKVTGKDSIGIVGELTEVISKDFKVNMQSFNIDTKEGMFEAKIKVQVKNHEHLDELIHKLLKVKGISKVNRLNK